MVLFCLCILLIFLCAWRRINMQNVSQGRISPSIVRAATLRKKLQLQLTVSSSDNILTPGDWQGGHKGNILFPPGDWQGSHYDIILFTSGGRQDSHYRVSFCLSLGAGRLVTIISFCFHPGTGRIIIIGYHSV